METLLIMLKNVVLFVLLAVPGYLMVRKKLLTTSQSGTLSALLTYVGMPGLILSSTLRMELTGTFTRNILLTAVAGTVFILIMFVTTAPLVSKKAEEKRRGMLRFCMIFANNGFIGIPLARAVFGEASPVIAYLTVLNIMNNVLIFTLGAYLISGDKRTLNVKQAVFNPVLLAFLSGIVLNLLKVCDYVPEVQTYASHFSGIVTPLSMVVMGMKLTDISMKKLFTSRQMYGVSGARLVLYPVLGTALVLLLQTISGLQICDEMVLAFFVAFAMPTAGFATVFADRYSGDTETAVVVTMGSTILSVVTIPVLYWLLNFCM